MTIISKKLKRDVDKLKKLVNKNNKTEDKEFARICKLIKINPMDADGDNLWDYIYNDSEHMVGTNE